MRTQAACHVIMKVDPGHKKKRLSGYFAGLAIGCFLPGLLFLYFDIILIQ
jgi:hypothetical protein